MPVPDHMSEPLKKSIAYIFTPLPNSDNNLI
jgi:hypothetical protein